MYAVNGGAYSTSNIITGLSAGSYTVSSIDSNGCMIKSTTTITQTGNNSPVITVNSDSICAGDTAILIAQGASSYTWMPSINLNTSLDSFALANPTSTTIYTITGADSLHCRGVTTCTVIVANANSIFCSNSTNGALQIHNAFSPNKDGLNDLFIIDNIEGFPNNHVYIYNRWGQLLWDKPKYNNSNIVWDGKSQDGATLYAGTYFYIIENVGIKNLKGWVEITSTIK
jgi:gliding motility-associated-like protein